MNKRVLHTNKEREKVSERDREIERRVRRGVLSDGEKESRKRKEEGRRGNVRDSEERSRCRYILSPTSPLVLPSKSLDFYSLS